MVYINKLQIQKYYSFNLLYLILFLSLLVFFLWSFFSQNHDVQIIKNKQKSFELLTHWSKGNIVMLIRHTDRCDRSDSPCLEAGKMEGITIDGKKKAQKIALGIKNSLPLIDTDIYNSPVKRTKQTAHIIFNDKSIEQDWLRKNCKNDFLNKIINHKHNGKNMILVTHATCMAEINSKGKLLINNYIKNDQSYGIAYFFVINKKDRQAYILGYINPEGWSLLNN